MLELYLLLAVMLAAALVASETRNLLAAAVALGLVGFSVAIMFILAQAPDLAIVQIVVETLTVVFFTAVILRTTDVDTTVTQGLKMETAMFVAAFLAFGGLFLALIIGVLREIPRFGEPVMRIAQEYVQLGLERTGAANIVSAIILDFRGYDTLGEATVLFTAVVGVLTVMRLASRKKPGEF
ncbi:MAG: hydrogen gas-evolving membrane-bound hydrogenase subunit E [candidate division WOR-3 bacterium]